ncbi:Solitary outer membrane autotransporter beta-barrel domain [Aliivibrio kagoshimensis]|uniref:Solitary outer membrane autotransporter beta-barrel domain n=1 Tax=Aliivibrio kagoshimensis TaxID=2910230 RepID=UPI003D09DAF4
MFRRSSLSLLLMLLASSAYSEQNFSAINRFEKIFAATVVLTDSSAITFGITDFDPSEFVSLPGDGDIEHPDSVELRKKITVYSFPYTYEFPDDNDDWSQSITGRIAYLRVDQTTEFFEAQGLTPDQNKDEVVAAYFEYAQEHRLSKGWSFGYGVGNHLMYYANTYSYRNQISEELKPRLDGTFLNTSTNTYLIEPTIKFIYREPTDWGEWRFDNHYYYFYGQGFGGSSEVSKEANPEGWRLINMLQMTYQLTGENAFAQSLFLRGKRVDVGGDITSSFGTHHYLEASIGWLLNTTNKLPFLDNVGIGFNFNYGSALRGGSIVLFYNEM